MSVEAQRQIELNFSGALQSNQVIAALINNDSPAVMEVKDLASGANTITAPTALTPVAVTIIPPADNTETLKLKGVTGDTGVGLSPSDPTSLGLADDVVTFVLTAGGAIAGVRFIWN